MNYIILGLFCLGSLHLVVGQNITEEREGKLFSMFQVIKFPNDICTGTNSRNGTCYTASECTSKSGTSAGTCASGYGVCCTFILGCGQTSSQNCTYVEGNGVTGSCKTSICRTNTNICQLRLDFTTFQITGPSTVTTSVGKVTNGELGGTGGTVSTGSQCLTDTFTVSPSNNVPVLCGVLTGDHIYVDASASCTDLNFVLGNTGIGNTIPTRSWQIKVTQFSCDFPNKAPQGCLQYFYGSTTGTVRSFNQGGSPAYHLANQKQTICIRRERSFCRICWSATAPTDFQVSAKTTSLKGFVKGTICCAYGAAGATTKGYDCVMIPGASNAATSPAGAKLGDSFCGRSLGLVKSSAATVGTTVCSRQTPFQLSFFSDNWEYYDIAAAEAKKSSGFKLAYVQSSC